MALESKHVKGQIKSEVEDHCWSNISKSFAKYNWGYRFLVSEILTILNNNCFVNFVYAIVLVQTYELENQKEGSRFFQIIILASLQIVKLQFIYTIN